MDSFDNDESHTDDEDLPIQGFRQARNRIIASSDEETDDDIIEESDSEQLKTPLKSSFESPHTNSSVTSQSTGNTSNLYPSPKIPLIEDSFTDDESDEDAVHYPDVVENSIDEDEVFLPIAPIQSSTLNNTYRDKIESFHDSDSDLEEIQVPHSIVDVSSDEEFAIPVKVQANLNKTALKQSNITSFLNPKPSSSQVELPTVVPKVEKRVVNPAEYSKQVNRVQLLESELSRTTNALRVIKLDTLPDKGKMLLAKQKSANEMLTLARGVLKGMEVDEPLPNAHNKIKVAWDEIEAGVGSVAPRTMGQKGMARYHAEKQLTIEALGQLHKSLDTCPGENDFAKDPKGFKVDLMPHQKRAVAWLLWREKQKPSGGLLADDMGLGKTLTMIALLQKTKELEGNDYQDGKQNERNKKYPGGTLVVCPASLINQWSSEVERRTKRGLISVEVYHGPKRETKAKYLAEHDMVITTYSIVMNERDRKGTIFRVKWRRIILDEAHQIRNHKSLTSEAVCGLSAQSRWTLTGTPIQNKELDMFALLKFLRCSPFDDLQVWKHWVGDKSSGGQERLHAVFSSLMLRRTKAELMEKGKMTPLPARKWELIEIKLDEEEMGVYQKVMIFSRTLFAQFLHQKAVKNQDAYDLKFTGPPPDPNGEYFKMRNKLLKLNKVKEVSQHEILVLLLRLRQICCHASLITGMLQGDEDLGNAEESEESEEMNLLEQISKLDINEEPTDHDFGDKATVGLKEASKGYLNPSNPVFAEDRPSSKVKALIKLLTEKVSTGDKAIVVSQWTSFLKTLAVHLKHKGLKFSQLDGSVKVTDRMKIVDRINDPTDNVRILLLSLTAGGVGLNLIGANHLFLLDLHWNPQLENQAQDRIYRMGQTKPIFVYKFMAVDTIEQRIKALQESKLEIAEAMLTGSKKVINSKLSLQDLKMLFDVK